MPRVLLLIVLSILAVGCGLLRGGSGAGGSALPDYPRVAATMTPGQTVTYRDLSLTLADIIREGDTPQVRFSIARGRETTSYTAAIGERVINGENMIQFQARADSDEDLAVAMMYHLPELMRPNVPRAARDLVETRPGEIAFFQDGFAAINAVSENDFVATDDDSVLLTIWTPGETMEDITLSVLRVGNVYGGENPGEGRVELRIVPLNQAWEDASDREELLIPYRGTIDWRGHGLRAETLPGGWRSRVLLTVQRADTTHDVVLTEGQAWRYGNIAWRFDGANGGAARITAFEFDRSVFPADTRVANRAPEQNAQNPRAPTTVERSLITNQSVEFWGARVRLARVLDMDATNLFDDVAEIIFDVNGRLETVQVREGDRATVRGENRWYVVEVKAATPSATNRSGRADIILTTGTFFNP
jgi:hypothetical protein